MPYKSAFSKTLWARTRRAKKRQKALEYLGNKCINCDQTEPSIKLEFDHIDPLKKQFIISRNLTIAWEKLLIELEKCQLLCNECHKNKTYDDPLF